MKRNSVFAVFSSREELNEAMNDLSMKNWPQNEIALLPEGELKLVDLGFLRHEAMRYEAMVSNGGGIISVSAHNEKDIKKLCDLFRSYGARDIQILGETRDQFHFSYDYQDESRRAGLDPNRLTDI